MDFDYNNSSAFQMNSYILFKKKINNLIEKLIENKIKINVGIGVGGGLNIKKNNNNLLKFKILDIGCSHGLNSNIQINDFINQIKLNTNYNKSLKIQVYHSDLPENDFTKLFQLLNNFENSYLKLQNNKEKQQQQQQVVEVSSYAIGNSFFNQIMPNDSCDFIFSFYALHWGSMSDQYYSFERSMINGKDQSKLPRINDCKERYSNILTHRLKELKKGGIFVCWWVVLENENDKDQIGGSYGSNEVAFQNIKEILREMYYDGLLEKDEVSKMVLPIMLLRQDEYEYAIQQVESKGLKLIEKSIHNLPWFETAMMGKSYNLVDDDEIEQNKYTTDCLNTILSFSGGFIHSTFSGDKSRKDLMFNEFKSRLTIKFKQSPKSFDFFSNALYLSFEKL